MTQICNYIKYENEKIEIDDETRIVLDQKVIQYVYNIDTTQYNITIGTTEEYVYLFNYFTLNYTIEEDTEVKFTIFLCAKRTVNGQVESFSDVYLCIPELSSAKDKVIGLNAYKVNTEQVKMNKTGADIIYFTINGGSEAILGYKETPNGFVFPNKSCFLEGRHENLYKDFEGKIYAVQSHGNNRFKVEPKS